MGFFTFLYQASGLQVSVLFLLHRSSSRPPPVAISLLCKADDQLRAKNAIWSFY